MKITSDMIDPQLRFRANLFKWLVGRNTEERLRKRARKSSFLQKIIFWLAQPKDATIEEKWIPRGDGTALRILIVSPKNKKPDATGLLWIHGGGYASGSPDIEIGFAYSSFGKFNSVIVSPDYRLSVEAPYPAALDDCYTALRWLKENTKTLGVRNDQIAVGGASAGGGLTAALTLYARDKNEISIAFQMPIYPMIDDRNETASAIDNNAPVWDLENNRLGWKIYLGDMYGAKDVSPYAAPARASDFSNLPPTCTYVGSIEPFCDETIAYAENLIAANVPVEYKVYEGAYHGFDAICPGANVSKMAKEFRSQWYQKAIREYFRAQPEEGS